MSSTCVCAQRNPTLLKRPGRRLAVIITGMIRTRKNTGVFSECGRCLCLVIIWIARGYKSVGFRYTLTISVHIQIPICNLHFACLSFNPLYPTYKKRTPSRSPLLRGRMIVMVRAAIRRSLLQSVGGRNGEEVKTIALPIRSVDPP